MASHKFYTDYFPTNDIFIILETRGSKRHKYQELRQIFFSILQLFINLKPLNYLTKLSQVFCGRIFIHQASQVCKWLKNLSAIAGDIRDACLISGSGRSPRVGHGNLLQYSWLANPMDRRAWQATIHIVTKSQTQVKGLSTYTYQWQLPWFSITLQKRMWTLFRWFHVLRNAPGLVTDHEQWLS